MLAQLGVGGHFGEDDAIVQPVGLALPELDQMGLHHVAPPGGRQKNTAVAATAPSGFIFGNVKSSQGK